MAYDIDSLPPPPGSAAAAAPPAAGYDIDSLPPPPGAKTAEFDKIAGAGRAGANQSVAALASIPIQASRYVLEAAKEGVRGPTEFFTGKKAPDWLQPNDGSKDVGGAEWMESHMTPPGMKKDTVDQNDPYQRYAAAGVGGLVTGGIPGVTGAVAQQGVKDMGGGEGAQAAASLLGTLGPVGLTKLAQVAGRAATGLSLEEYQAAHAANESIGVTPTMLNTAKPESIANVAGKVAAYVPGGAGVIRNANVATSEQAAQTVMDIAENIAPGQPAATDQTMGIVVRNQARNQWLPAQSAIIDGLYNARAANVPPTTMVNMTGTVNRIAALTASDPEFEKFLRTDPNFGRLFDLRDSVVTNSDRYAAQTASAGSGWSAGPSIGGRPTWVNLSTGEATLTQPAGLAAPGTAIQIPFSEADKLQRRLGQMTDHSVVNGSASNGLLKAVGGAMSADITNGIATVSPTAVKADAVARQAYTALSEQRDQISPFIREDANPEDMFNSLMGSTKQGSTSIDAVARTMNVPQRQLLASTMLRRLGTLPDDTFSGSMFLKNWDRVDPNSRDTVFGAVSPQYTADMDTFTNFARDQQARAKIYMQTSGTTPSAQLIKGAGEVGGAGLAVAMGHPIVAASLIAPMAGAYGTAKLLTSPTFAKWLLNSTKVPVGAVSAMATQLTQIAAQQKNQDMANFANALQHTSSGGQGQRPPPPQVGKVTPTAQLVPQAASTPSAVTPSRISNNAAAAASNARYNADIPGPQVNTDENSPDNTEPAQ